MDPHFLSLKSSNGFQLENQSMAEFSNRELGDGLILKTAEDEYHDDCDFSDGILKYIDQILMEEDVDDESHFLQESLDFQAKERSFYEVLGQKYPPSPQQELGHNNQYVERPYYSNYVDNHHSSMNDSCDSVRNFWKGVEDASKFLAGGSKLLGSNELLILNPEGEITVDSKNELKTKKSGAKVTRNSRKPIKKKEVIDFTTLLMDCAQSVSVNDGGTAKELLRQIRHHSSPFGNGDQRLAHYFADGLEARLAANGSEVHKALVCRRTTASDHMKAFSTYMASSPLGKITFFTLNKSMAIKSEKAMRVHIIDFGILCGFQWPTFIQRLAEREGGPPKLRITGIDYPLPGFRPAERIETAGRWLARHAKTLNVPFEFNAIAQKWETIKIEDLKIEEGEFVAVSCSCRSKNLQDEPLGSESPRNIVLDLIRKINPDIFLHCTVNAAYGDPFFVSRFRKALFHFSDLFDVLETTIPREKPERLLIERDIFGKEALNIIACEGQERVERPETYKQWHLRHLRAGFVGVPFEKTVIDTVMYKAREFNLRKFVVIEDNNWLLLSWKGRIIYAISCWQPV